MIKKGIVTDVQSNGTWEGKFGLMYKFEVTIGDDTGQCLSKTDTCKFVVGEEVDYEFVGGQYPKIKPVTLSNKVVVTHLSHKLKTTTYKK